MLWETHRIGQIHQINLQIELITYYMPGTSSEAWTSAIVSVKNKCSLAYQAHATSCHIQF